MLLHELRDPIAGWNWAQTPTAGFVSKKEARREGEPPTGLPRLERRLARGGLDPRSLAI